MNSRHTNIALFVLLIMIVTTVAGCRRPPRFPVPPPVVIDGRPHHKPKHRIKHYRYRYYPVSQVYYDHSRRVYFYYGKRGWVSVPVLPRHIHIDIDNYVTVDLEGPKPHIHHKRVLKNYPANKYQKKRRKEIRKEKKERRKEYKKEKREERREYREDKRESRKEYREDRREDRKDRREDYREDREDHYEDRYDDRHDYRDDDYDDDRKGKKGKKKKKNKWD